MTSPPVDRPPVLQVNGLCCTFGATRALADVDLTVNAGEVVALLGQNGAGKSTLIKLLAGVHRPTGGLIHLGGRRFEAGLSPADARANGLAFVHQDLGLIGALSVAENIAHVAGFRRRGPFVSWREQKKLARRVLARWQFDVDPDATVDALEPSARALVAIARALAVETRTLVLDEPTASLPRQDAEVLLDAVVRLRAAGVGVLYVTHRLSEVGRVADRVVVLRDGHVVSTFTGDVGDQDIVEAITGRSVAQDEAPTNHVGGGIRLRLDDVHSDGVAGVSLDVASGEVLALVGLVGSGQRDVGKLVAGAKRPHHGSMSLSEMPYRPRTPRDAQLAGVAYLPSDRIGEASFPALNSGTNYALRAGEGGVIRKRAERARARTRFTDWAVTPPTPDTPFATLSGGNQQRVLLAKWMDRQPGVLVADEPTAGVDIGAKSAIYRRLADGAANGMSVLLVSSDAEEVSAIAHRAIVFRHGRVAAELERSELTVERILLECGRV